MPRAATHSAIAELERPAELPLIPDDSPRTGHGRVLLFSLAGRVHCAGLGSVREIIQLLPVTSLPGALPHVRGLINLRGTIVTVLDATMCEYGVPSSAPTASILLVDRGTRVAGVVVDEVHDIGQLDRDAPLESLLDLSAMVQMALA